MTKLHTKLVLLTLASTTLLGLASPIMAQELKKTPDLTKDFSQTQASQASSFTMPSGYPEELNSLTEDTRSYVVIDQDTHKVLMEREGNKPYPIASMSKIMSVYLTYKAIEEGKIKLDDKIKTPESIVRDFTDNAELSNAGLVTGAEYTVQDLLYGIMLASGNDATTLLMSHIYGSEQEAVAAIRRQLDEWGIENYEFYTTSGAPNKYLPESYWIEGSTKDSQNKMSAADVALMAQYITEKYPQILELSSAREYTMAKDSDHPIKMANNNLLLEGAQYGRPGVTGLKSGYTDEAGKCFVTTTTENGRKMIAVVMGVQEPYSSYEETKILLDGLNKHPDLYQLEGLATNLLPTQAEKEAQAAKAASEEAASKAQAAGSDKEENVESLPNRRNNPFTNFMRSIFGIFN